MKGGSHTPSERVSSEVVSVTRILGRASDTMTTVLGFERAGEARDTGGGEHKLIG